MIWIYLTLGGDYGSDISFLNDRIVDSFKYIDDLSRDISYSYIWFIDCYPYLHLIALDIDFSFFNVIIPAVSFRSGEFIAGLFSVFELLL